MEAYVCTVCGYIALTGEAPDNCPNCGAPKDKFQKKSDALILPEDPKNMTELEKKHVPQIRINKTCDLMGEGCLDVHARMGGIVHPMKNDHYITWVDFYLNKEFASREKLTPEKTQPAGCVHLNAGSGDISVVINCNKHGNWIAESSI